MRSIVFLPYLQREREIQPIAYILVYKYSEKLFQRIISVLQEHGLILVVYVCSEQKFFIQANSFNRDLFTVCLKKFFLVKLIF